MKNNETANRYDEIDTLHFDLSVLDELLYMDFAELDQALNIPTEQAGWSRSEHTERQRFRGILFLIDRVSEGYW